MSDTANQPVQTSMPTIAVALAGAVALALIGGGAALWHNYGTVMFVEMLGAAVWSCF